MIYYFLFQLTFLLVWLVLSGIYAFIAPICSEVWELRVFHADYEYLRERVHSESSISSKPTQSSVNIDPSHSKKDVRNRRISFVDS